MMAAIEVCARPNQVPAEYMTTRTGCGVVGDPDEVRHWQRASAASEIRLPVTDTAYSPRAGCARTRTRSPASN